MLFIAVLYLKAWHANLVEAFAGNAGCLSNLAILLNFILVSLWVTL